MPKKITPRTRSRRRVLFDCLQKLDFRGDTQFYQPTVEQKQL